MATARTDVTSVIVSAAPVCRNRRRPGRSAPAAIRGGIRTIVQCDRRSRTRLTDHFSASLSWSNSGTTTVLNVARRSLILSVLDHSNPTITGSPPGRAGNRSVSEHSPRRRQGESPQAPRRAGLAETGKLAHAFRRQETTGPRRARAFARHRSLQHRLGTGRAPARSAASMESMRACSSRKRAPRLRAVARIGREAPVSSATRSGRAPRVPCFRPVTD